MSSTAKAASPPLLPASRDTTAGTTPNLSTTAFGGVGIDTTTPSTVTSTTKKLAQTPSSGLKTVVAAVATSSAPITATPVSVSTSTSTPMSQRNGRRNLTQRKTVGCPANVRDYSKISVHTAKCSVCDKRNGTNQMLRCPVCYWEICQPCQQKREESGTNLVIAHGKLGLVDSATSRATLFTPTKQPRVDSRCSATANANGANKEEVTSASKPQQVKNNVHDVKKGKKYRKVAVDAHAPVSSPLRTSELKAMRAAVTKRKAVVEASGLDIEKDDGRQPLEGSPSPTMSPKRAKTSDDANADASRGKDQSTQEVKDTSPPTMKGPEIVKDYAQSVAEDRKAVREYYGDLLDGYTNEGHLLARRMPPTDNQVLIPAKIANMAYGKKRPTAEEIHQNIQAKLREKMAESSQAAKKTIREFAVEVAVGFRGGELMTDEQRGTLLYPVRKFLDKEVSSTTDGANLDLPVVTLEEKQKEDLVALIRHEMEAMAKDQV